MNFQEALKTMGFEKRPDDTTLKKRYKKLATKYHPDVAGNEHVENFKRVAKAYDFLKEHDTDPNPYGGTSATSYSQSKNVFTHQSIFTVFVTQRA